MLLYTYISRFSVNPQHQQKRIIRQSYRRNSVPNHFSSRFSTSRTNGPRSLSRVKAGYNHSPLLKGSHTRAYTAKQGRFGWGWYYYPRTVSHVAETLRGQMSERRTLPFLGLGRVYARRTQKAFGTAMRLCASLSRGVAAPLGCVIFSLLPKLRLVHPALSAFRMCETRGGITTLGALCVLLKHSAPACQSDSFVIF